MVKTVEEREAIKQRLKAAKKRWECNKCGCKTTVLVSLSCNCGGAFESIS